MNYARQGNLEGLKRMGRYMPEVFHNKDPNGWTVLHESVRAGHLDMVQFLIDEQAIDKDLITTTGVSPLSIARESLGDHPVTKFLESIDAEEIHPHKKRRTTTSDRKNQPASMPSSVKKRQHGNEL